MATFNLNEYSSSKYAITLLTAWLVPRLYIHWNRVLLQWIRQHRHQHKLSSSEREEEIRSGIRKLNGAAWLTSLICLILLLGGSYLVHEFTQGLDPNMLLLLAGLSRLVASAVILCMSLDIPIWLGVYQKPQYTTSDSSESSSSSSSTPPTTDTTSETTSTSKEDLQEHPEHTNLPSRSTRNDAVTGESCVFPISALRSEPPSTASTSPRSREAAHPTCTLPVVPEEEPLEGIDATCLSLPHVRQALCRSIVWQVSNILGFAWLFSCGDSSGTASVWSLHKVWILGLFWGFVLTFGIYVGRTRLSEKQRRRAACMAAASLAVIGIFGIGLGIWFVQTVWYPGASDRQHSLTAFAAVSVSLAVFSLAHYVTCHKQRRTAEVYQTRVRDYSTHGTLSDTDSSDKDSSFEAVLFSPRRIMTNLSLASSDEDDEERNLTRDRCDSGFSLASDASSEMGRGIDQERFVCVYGDTPSTESSNRDKDTHSQRRRAVGTRHSDPLNYGWKLFRHFLSVVMQTGCIVIIFINIGATQQGNYAKKLFPSVHAKLYEGQENGPVCAYAEAFNDDETMTFESADAAEAANHTIAHCGACGSCSTWQNLELQWTTRHNLALLSRKCAKVKLFQGWEKAMECHYDTIGFDEECSECWVQVEGCATKHCLFIQMQASIIARLGNFEVGPDVVTAAMCEEAICEVDFVPCSGANRRRMNIVSEIDRPNEQQCSLISESNTKWLNLFGKEDEPI